MTDAASNLINAMPAGLTQQEMEFVWNLEGLGLPARKAASLAGVPYGILCKPHIVQAREALKREIRSSMQITREDVIHGIREAIDRAKIINEPGTEIMGWKEIARIAGLDAPQRIDVNITSSLDVLKTHVRQMDDTTLARLVGAADVIDVDFYPVPADGEKQG